MNQARILLLAAALAGLAACQPQAGGSAVGNVVPVATVNGTVIGRDFFEFYIKGITGKPASELSADQRRQALDNLIRAQLVAQEASREGIDKNADTVTPIASITKLMTAMVVMDAELSRLNVLQQAVSDRYLKDKKPTEPELRAEYENQVAALPKLEYHARHILLATEPFAQKIVERLAKGEKFEDLAKRESMDSSKDNGGDLGWFTPDRMVKPFADAVVGLKPGEFTHKPVQTQYGWHVIQLVETRDLAAPSFDQVRQRLEQLVQAKKFKAYTDELMRNAKIDKKLTS